MQNSQPSLFTRHDTIFGVCEGIGEDFGFNAQLLRAILAVTLLWNPVVAISAYAVAGVAVLLSRRLFPNAPASAVEQPEVSEAATVALKAENDAQPVDLAAVA